MDIKKYINQKITLKKTNESGIIVDVEYMSNLNHYMFIIKTDKGIVNTFNKEDFVVNN